MTGGGSHALKLINGFEKLEEEIENELQPWNNDITEYEGNFLDGKKHGLGRFVYSNGDIYKGIFQMDMRHGTGIMLYKEGGYYKGTWQNDLYHGKGIWK